MAKKPTGVPDYSKQTPKQSGDGYGAGGEAAMNDGVPRESGEGYDPQGDANTYIQEHHLSEGMAHLKKAHAHLAAAGKKGKALSEGTHGEYGKTPKIRSIAQLRKVAGARIDELDTNGADDDDVAPEKV